MKTKSTKKVKAQSAKRVARSLHEVVLHLREKMITARTECRHQRKYGMTGDFYQRKYGMTGDFWDGCAKALNFAIREIEACDQMQNVKADTRERSR